MGSSRSKRGKTGGKNRVWDDWQRYVKKETQRLRQKPGGSVVEVRFAERQQAKPPEERPEHREMPLPEEFEGRRPPVPGVPREEALEVSDDQIGKTVRPFTVEDYRRIKPLTGDDPFDAAGEAGIAEPMPQPAPSSRAGRDAADVGVKVLETKKAPRKAAEKTSAQPAAVTQAPALFPIDEKTPRQRGRRKKKTSDGELELFDSVSEHQALSRQRLTRKARMDREELIEKLLDPVISLEEAATLIGVCKTTVRRYTNKGDLKCIRTPGQQRRFKLSHVLAFVKKREEDQKVRKDRKPARD